MDHMRIFNELEGKDAKIFSLSTLQSFNDDQDVELNRCALAHVGGLMGLEQGLRTDYMYGLSSHNVADLERRRKTHGRNEFPEPERQTFIQMFLESFEDTTLIVLIVAAFVSLAVGLYEDPASGWVEGAAILFAVLLVAAVTAINNYRKESQFRKLNAVKDDITVGVIRDGLSINVNVKELVVGDIIRLNAGDRVPCDGVMVDGSDVTCNESALTGESDDKKKDKNKDVFFISGATVSTGYCKVCACAVGEQSRWGKTKAKLSAESVPTPLQEKLDTLAGQIGHLGMGCAGATFVVMVAVWVLYPATRANNHQTIFDFVLHSFIVAVTIVVVAVPEGLPLAVTLSLAYSTQKMMSDNCLIRVLEACETMGNATNICSDKTGTLTQNKMTVVEAWVAGKHHRTKVPGGDDVPESLKHALCVGIAVNSTAVLITPTDGGQPLVSGSKTEGALLMMLASSFGQDYVPIRAACFDASLGDRLFTFSSARKCMTVLLASGSKHLPESEAAGDKPNSSPSPLTMVSGVGQEGVGVAYTKGASEVILKRCVSYTAPNGQVFPLIDSVRKDVEAAIALMARNALRTVALAHRSLSPLTGQETDADVEQALTLDAIFGIKDPLRPDVTEAVRTCQSAGIFVRMVTGDNIETAKAIAKECGILTPGGLAMEGPDFRKLTPAQVDALLPTLQVLARSSPDDKHMLVTRLNGHALPEGQTDWEALHPGASWIKDRDLLMPGYREEWALARAAQGGTGEVVGVTGDGTNDGPALKAADVGLSMGIAGTDVAKEASDIVIMDDNFSSIVKAVMWGRAVFDNIRKFLQFQLTVNGVALTITFVTALSGKEPPLNAVMMLWVNLIMDTMGALALGTEPPSAELLSRRPYRRNASLINAVMMRNILVQFVFQIALMAYLLTTGAEDFSVLPHSTAHFTVVFNTFVLCQVFNEINARRIGNEMNVFKGLSDNPLFGSILLFTCIAQYFLVTFGGDFVRTVPLSYEQWVKCILLGALSLPVGGLMRLIPVRENDKDFAALSPLLIKANPPGSPLKRTGSSLKRSNSMSREAKGRVMSVSFLVWFLVATMIPLVCFSVFGEHWTPRMQRYFP